MISLCRLRPGSAVAWEARNWRLPQRHRRPNTAVAGAGSSARESAEEGQGTHALSRRAWLAGAAALMGASSARAVELPPPPAIGDCPECIGEVNDTLNACSLSSTSCVSTLNDDADHFVAPWMYDGDREAAVTRLIDVATGGRYDPGLLRTPGGISQLDAAAFIAGGVLAVVKGEKPPPRPQRQKATEYTPFDGVVTDRHITETGSNYIRLVLGTAGGTATEVEDPSKVIDAEFLFLPNDSIVVVRASARAEPSQRSGQLQLSFTEGLVVDRNTARRQSEALRVALNWELAPVLTDFNPAFNKDAPIWFERLFKPFDERNQFTPSGEAYPTENLPRLSLPE